MAAGSGAAAVNHLNGDSAEAGSGLKPAPPAGPPSGRPKAGGREASADAKAQMWLETFQAIAGSDTTITKDDCIKCASMAAMLQASASEVISMCLTAGLDEERVRNVLKADLFKSEPSAPLAGDVSPEASASSSTEAPASASSKLTEGSAPAAAAQPGTRPGLAVGPSTSTGGKRMSAMPMPVSLGGAKDSANKGFMICKHLEGDPGQVYDMGHQVGEGTFGSVRKARHRQTGQIHAVKAVPKTKIEEGELWAEIGIMKQLDHPHIMRLYYTFEDKDYVYMASEICAGGELYDTLDETGFFNERTAAVLMRQILGAVNYLHASKQICHRDLKPENFLVLKRVEPEQAAMLHLKLIDFGTAKRFDKHPLVTKVCTAHYVAPEVLKRGAVEYSEKVDVWSCGVMLYMLLCGFMPFHHDTNTELLKLVKKGKYAFNPSAVWSLISEPAKDLIRKMMCVKVQDRFTATQAFQHEWTQQKDVEGVDGVEALPDDEIVKNMRKFLTNNRLKRVALQIIARQINDESITKLRNIFLKIDADNSGTLTVQEMDEALAALDVPVQSRKEMAAIMESIGQDEAGELEYTEFLAAMLTQEQYLQEEICKGAFHLLDVDGDGVLTKTDLQALLSSGAEVTLTKAAIQEIDQIMSEVDENGDGDLCFEEFMTLMRDDGPAVGDSAVSLRWKRGHNERKVDLSNIDAIEEEAEEEPVEADGKVNESQKPVEAG